MPKITVGIPAYKTRFLVEAISSVLAQTFGDFELLVSDDSPDGAAGDIVRRFRDPRIRVIQGPRQGLVPNSVNIWEHASADLLKFLYDDDYLFPTALEELAGLLEKNRFTFAASRRVVVDEYGRELQRPVTYQTDDWMWFEPAQLASYLVRSISNPLGEPSNFLIRRSAFPDSSCLSRFAGLPITHLIDVAFMLNATQYGPCAATGKYLSAFRQHGEQVSSRSTAPGFSLGVLEWEICLRGAVELGLVSPQAALGGVPNLEGLYRRYGRPYPEIQHFFRQLPALKELLGAGVREVLTPQFRADLQRAENTIQARRASADETLVASTEMAQDSEAKTPRRVRAEIESVTRRGARGWAWIPDQPEQTVHVEAMVGHRVIGHGVADLERPQLKAWNLGTGKYGFQLNFYEPLVSDEAPQFRFFTGAEVLRMETSLPPVGPGAATRRERAEAPLLEHARFTAPGPQFEEFHPIPLTERAQRLDGPDPLLVAFYLPQFHAIAENDENWGRGFTEWRQLPRGIPRFPGHYQPRIPRDLGFYNLLDEEVIERQCRMAQAAGVGAFAFYYYWFNGRRVLDRPVEIFLGSAVEMPFFVIWTNENWTRGWDGFNDNVLLKQDYRREDEDALLADLARHMGDARYVRLEGRPLFVIYNPDEIPDTAETVARWRGKWAHDHGLQPLIFMAQAFDREDPRQYGLDGALEFPPHKLLAKAPSREVLDAFSKEFASVVTPYDGFVRASLSEAPPSYPLIKTLVPSWDNEARRPNRGLVLEGSTPQRYEAWLQALVERAMERPVYGAPIVGINAWNEWAEGAYLEPDVHFGSAYLNATSRALDAAIRSRNAAVEPRQGRGERRAAKDRPLRICIAALSFGVGGGEIAPVQIANELCRRGHHVSYLVLENTDLEGGKHIRERLRPDIAVFRWDKSREAIEAFFRDNGIQAFNSHNIGVDFHLHLAGVQDLPPYVVSLHGGYESTPETLTPAFMDYVRKFDRWLYLTEKNLAPLRAHGIDPAKFTQVFNGAVPGSRESVDHAAVRAQYGIPQAAFTLVLASRAVPEKGWRTAVEVVRRVQARGRDVHLVLAGEGPAADELRQACAGESFITFAGHVADTAPLLAACDLALFPSTFAGESSPLFLLECLSMSLPILSTDMGEIPGMFGAEEAKQPGRVFPSELSTEELATGMADSVLQAMDDAALLARWRRNADLAVSRFDMGSLVEIYEATFRKLAQAAAERTAHA